MHRGDTDNHNCEYVRTCTVYVDDEVDLSLPIGFTWISAIILFPILDLMLTIVAIALMVYKITEKGKYIL